MKKAVWVVVVIAIAIVAVWTLTNRNTVAEEKTVVKEIEKTPGETVTTTTTVSPGTVKAREKTEYMPGVDTNQGYLKECVATFERIDEKNMHAYFIKDNQLYRLKYPENMKENVLRYKKGDKVRVWSTYPLDAQELAKYSGENQLQRCESVK